MDTRKVLIAEDDSSVRKAVQRVLELENYQVTAVNDGQAALEALSKSRFDLAVLDVMMPFADGLTVCKEARHRGIDVPIYPTITAEDYAYIINHSESKYCFVSDQEVFDKIKPIPMLRALRNAPYVKDAI